MPPSRRTQRSRSEVDDDFDDFEDFGSSSEAARERIRQLISDLIGRWYWIFLGLVVGILGALYFLSKAPPKFESSASLLVKQQTASVMAKDQVEEMDLSSDEALNTVAQRIKRSGLLTKVASDKDLISKPGFFLEPVDWFPEWSKNGLEQKTMPLRELLVQRRLRSIQILKKSVG